MANENTFTCDGCEDEIDANQILCSAPGCTAVLCIGCAYECADCNESFCLGHVERGEEIAPNTVDCFRCDACHAKRQPAIAA